MLRINSDLLVVLVTAIVAVAGAWVYGRSTGRQKAEKAERSAQAHETAILKSTVTTLEGARELDNLECNRRIKAVEDRARDMELQYTEKLATLDGKFEAVKGGIVHEVASDLAREIHAAGREAATEVTTSVIRHLQETNP